MSNLHWDQLIVHSRRHWDCVTYNFFVFYFLFWLHHLAVKVRWVGTTKIKLHGSAGRVQCHQRWLTLRSQYNRGSFTWKNHCGCGRIPFFSLSGRRACSPLEPLWFLVCGVILLWSPFVEAVSVSVWVLRFRRHWDLCCFWFHGFVFWKPLASLQFLVQWVPWALAFWGHGWGHWLMCSDNAEGMRKGPFLTGECIAKEPAFDPSLMQEHGQGQTWLLAKTGQVYMKRLRTQK